MLSVFFPLKENQIRGVDLDEVDFLNQVDEVKLKNEKLKREEEKKELDEYKISFLFT